MVGINGYYPGYHFNSHIDSSNGQGVGLARDAQARFDPMTGVTLHGASAWANMKEAGFDALGMIPGVGTVANAGRGLFNIVKGVFTGNGAEISAGFRQVGKGLLYAIPGVGQAIAGVNFAKNTADAGMHAAAAVEQQVMWGGAQNQIAMTRMMAYGNMGYGAGLMYGGGYPAMGLGGGYYGY